MSSVNLSVFALLYLFQSSFNVNEMEVGLALSFTNDETEKRYCDTDWTT